VINIDIPSTLRDTAAVDDEPLAAMDPVELIETAEPPTGIDPGEEADGLDDLADAENGEQA